METKTKHTPTPWHTGHFGESEFGREIVFDAHSGQVCEAIEPDDAAFIVRSCNAHDDLYAALERVCIAISPDVARHVLGANYAAVLDSARDILAFVKAMQ